MKEIICYGNGRYVEVIELTDQTQRIPKNKAVQDIMSLLVQDEGIARTVYYKLKQHLSADS